MLLVRCKRCPFLVIRIGLKAINQFVPSDLTSRVKQGNTVFSIAFLVFLRISDGVRWFPTIFDDLRQLPTCFLLPISPRLPIPT